ncbi:hypothetical protein ED28_18975 [[Pantoea] beijingensis]|uniref:Uncharacterized protein n=1 Tax=[Pantoea] beijingensis TaxID=1324864 RepID=A0A443I911_9GAMM|nr:hypothetical protein ED28_18975 [[Pantoea] beijingensis]
MIALAIVYPDRQFFIVFRMTEKKKWVLALKHITFLTIKSVACGKQLKTEEQCREKWTKWSKTHVGGD